MKTLSKLNLGCVPSIPDKRDYVYKVAPLLKLPALVDLRKDSPPILNQGQIGACTGFGVGRAFRRLRQTEKRRAYAPSQLFLYYNARVLHNTVQSDSGASIRNAIKTAADAGVAESVRWPYLPSKFTTKPPAAAYRNAKLEGNYAIQYQSLASIYDIKTALVQGFSVVIGYSVYTNFFDIKSDGQMPEPQGRVEGGHCVTIDGYDDRTQRFTCSNSWGTGWGSKGYFYMPYSAIDYVFDKWIIQDL